MTEPRKSAAKTRGRPFQPGNAGKPKGTRHRATLAAEALFDGEAQALSRKAVELALAGDVVALRLCLERVCPPRRDRPVCFALPALEHASDAPRAIAAIVAAVSDGSLTTPEADDLASLVDKFVKAVEISEHAERLAAIEKQLGLRK